MFAYDIPTPDATPDATWTVEVGPSMTTDTRRSQRRALTNAALAGLLARGLGVYAAAKLAVQAADATLAELDRVEEAEGK